MEKKCFCGQKNGNFDLNAYLFIKNAPEENWKFPAFP